MNKKYSVLLASLLLILSITSCSNRSGVVPLPSSSHNYIPDMDILPNNQIAFPFPYTDDFPNGIEQWGLGKDLDGKTVMVGRWTPKDGTYLNRQIASFPIVGIGDYPLTGELTLGGNTYTAISIHVNTTEILTGSGWIVLQAK